LAPLRGLLRRRSRNDGVSAVLAGAASAAAAEVEADLAAPVDRTAAAFFDVDNTVMQGASIYYFAKGLAARKFFTSTDLARFAWREVRFRVSGESMQHMAKAREAALAFVAGHDVEEVVALCEGIYDEMMAERIWSGTRALAEQHLASGQRVWLVTATPVELARIISSRLTLTGARPAIDGGHDQCLVAPGELRTAAQPRWQEGKSSRQQEQVEPVPKRGRAPVDAGPGPASRVAAPQHDGEHERTGPDHGLSPCGLSVLLAPLARQHELHMMAPEALA